MRYGDRDRVYNVALVTGGALVALVWVLHVLAIG